VDGAIVGTPYAKRGSLNRLLMEKIFPEGSQEREWGEKR